jgi:SET domain-containing protein
MKKSTSRKLGPLFEVRHSDIHGRGVFALRRIRKGTTIIEYLGDVITHDQADERYEDKDPRDNHTFLFTVDSKHVIDAGVNGNEARFINHGCDPNCQSTGLRKRIWIEAIRTIQPGEELSYDYQITRDKDDPADADAIFACRCGAENCRGSMLEPLKKPRKAKRRRQKPPTKRVKNRTKKRAVPRQGAKRRRAR